MQAIVSGELQKDEALIWKLLLGTKAPLALNGPRLDALNDLEWFWMTLHVQCIRFRQVLDARTSGNRISRSGPEAIPQSCHITKALAYVHSKGTTCATCATVYC